MPRITLETLRELDNKEMAVCRTGSVLDGLEASNECVDKEAYSQALAAWKLEIMSLIAARDAILTSLSYSL